MRSVAARSRERANPLHGYLPVHVDLLRHLSVVGVDVFTQADSRQAPTLYCRAGLPLGNHRLLSLGDAGVREVYVRTTDFAGFGAQLLESVDAQLEQQVVSPAERYAVLQLAVAVEVEHASRMVDCSKLVSLSDRVGRDLVAILTASSVLPSDLFRIARHDFNTFTHVTNCASYCVVLAQSLGISAQAELEQVAIAAMLHDIGKRFIPASVLTKPTRLLPAERELIETHPLRGYEELCERPDLNFGQLMMVYQHHEHVDGSGYPVGITSDEIHPWAKLLAVVDVFDAMTGTRPYRRPCSALEAMEYICKNAGTHFDPEMVACWNSTMTKS
jgi:HD-GYP domain-containing protein (c-di-GMP phosphodiesterase class II)